MGRHWKTYATLIALLFAAVTYVAKQATDMNGPRSAQTLSVDDLRTLDVSAYSQFDNPDTEEGRIKKAFRRHLKTNHLNQKVAGLKPFKPKTRNPLKKEAGEHSFTHDKGKKASKDKKKKDNKKKDKKTAKKNKEDANEEIVENEENKNSKKKETEDSNPPQNGLQGAYAGSPPLPGQAPNPNSEIPEDYAAWEQLLLVYPSQENTNRFIEYYLAGMISDDIYFNLVNDMTTDDRESVVEMGITAAGMVPAYRSFVILAHTIHSYDHGTKLRSYADSFVEGYQSLSHTKVFEQVFKGNQDSLIALELASRQTLLTAKRHLKGDQKLESPQNLAERSTANVEENFKHPNGKYFSGIVAQLKILKTHEDNNINALAEDTLNELLTYLQ